MPRDTGPDDSSRELNEKHGVSPQESYDVGKMATGWATMQGDLVDMNRPYARHDAVEVDEYPRSVASGNNSTRVNHSSAPHTTMYRRS